MGTTRRSSLLTLVGSGYLALAGTAAAQDLNTISAVQLSVQGADRVIRIATAQKPTYQRFTLSEPQRLVLDFVGSEVKGVPALAGVGDALVAGIKVEESGVSGQRLSRVMVTFKDEAEYTVATVGNDVVVKAHSAKGSGGDATAAAPVVLAQAEAPAAQPAEAAPAGETERHVAVSNGPKAMSLCGMRFSKETSRVFVRTSEPAKYAVRKEGGHKVVVELMNSSIPLRNNRRFLDTQYFASPIKLITPSVVNGSNPMVRIEIELKDDVPFKESQNGNEVMIDFANPG